MKAPDFDTIVFSPREVDLARSPLSGSLTAETHVLGAFNPALTRLRNGNLLMMVRIAEALLKPIYDENIHAIRWDPQKGYVLDPYPMASVDATDPRKFRVLGYHSRVMALTSLSWLLPVELSPDGSERVAIHYDRAIAPRRTFQEYGVEDARISQIDETYYMTVCSVSAERHSTSLYTSSDGLNYDLRGTVLDHQNKDMVLFNGKAGGRFYALTRPLGDLYFAYPPESPYQPGPSINLAVSPDAMHWRPVDTPLIRARKGSSSAMKIGGGTPPIRSRDGWLLLYHGVEASSLVGVYRTFWALLDGEDPSKLLRVEDETPLLEANPALTEPYRELMYLSDIVFSTGIVEEDSHYLVASGEADLVCRLTRLPKTRFA